jgi:signal transduction histidine kinase
VLVVAVCVGHSWLLARRDLANVRAYLDDRGRSLAAQLGRDAAVALGDADVESMQSLVVRARAASGVLYARVLDHRGLLLAAAGQPPATAAHGAGGVDQAAPIPIGPDVWEFRAPIAVADPRSPPADALGTAVVGLSLEPLHALRRRGLRTATLFAALSALLGILGAGMLARALTRPLRALVEAADRISRGDFAARVVAGAHDEVGRLGGSFNAMAESLARSRAALEDKVRQLERADHLKSEFLATVSHELRTPLNVILGCTEMLGEGAAGELTPEQAEMVQTIDRYSRNQLELILSVLDFTRLTSGKVSVNVERFTLATLLREIETQQRARLESADVALRLTIDPAVVEVETDRIKLQQILRNLVDNAVKFTAAGTVSVRAQVGEPGWLVLEVADSGPGIPPEELEAVFEPFYQIGDSSTRSTGGVGLGLSIVRRLAEALGGSVSVSSTVGEGSVFRVLLPCVPMARPATADDTATTALAATASNTSLVGRRRLRAVRGRRARGSDA